jgi:RNA-splicing ligase RtcB
MVGVDIGCGMETVEIDERELDFKQLDEVIRCGIPAGREVREDYHTLNEEIDLSALRCVNQVQIDRARRSIGTLGGGNHFIEIDHANDGRLFLVVHSGSRHLGTEVAGYYQNEAYRRLSGNSKAQLDETIAALKSEGRQREIQATVKKLQEEGRQKPAIPKDLAYATGSLFDDYIHDMKIIQRFAVLNRQAMTEVILRKMNLTKVDGFTTVHNYIDTESMILRKGAVSAKVDERLLIPMNMRDGSLICLGKGNDEWNCSAPHGAGRIMSRKAAFGNLSMEQYQEQMKGIFTTSVTEATLDDSPRAYKGMDVIVNHIAPTAEIQLLIKPLYNFKAGD